MSTPKTTQQLARELANILQSKDRADIDTIREILMDSGIDLSQNVYVLITSAIRAEIDKEAASIKKALQEALANE